MLSPLRGMTKEPLPRLRLPNWPVPAASGFSTLRANGSGGLGAGGASGISGILGAEPMHIIVQTFLEERLE